MEDLANQRCIIRTALDKAIGEGRPLVVIERLASGLEKVEQAIKQLEHWEHFQTLDGPPLTKTENELLQEIMAKGVTNSTSENASGNTLKLMVKRTEPGSENAAKMESQCVEPTSKNTVMEEEAEARIEVRAITNPINPWIERADINQGAGSSWEVENNGSTGKS